MDQDFEKIGALEAVATKWSEEGITWGVANGLEDYPRGIGRDLDILIGKGELKRAVQIVIDVLVPMNWIVLPNLQGWIWWIVAFRRHEDGSIHSLQIDLFERLQWAFTWVATNVGEDGPLVKRGPFLEDPGAAVVKRFLLNGLSSGIRTFKKKGWYLEFTEPELAALPCALSRISGREWPKLIEAAIKGDLKSLESELVVFKKVAYRHALTSPKKGARLVSAFQKQWVVNIAPRQGAPVVQVRIADESHAREVTTTLTREIESLVFQEVKVLTRDACSASSRMLQKLSCLQVVLVFVNAPIPSGLRADLLISVEGNDQVISIATDDGGPSQIRAFDLETLRTSLLEWLEIRGSQLLQRHQFSRTDAFRKPIKP